MVQLKTDQLPDENQESQSFHLVDDYEAIKRNQARKGAASGDKRDEDTAASAFLQAPQKADFSILIGHFDSPKNDRLHDPIQSYYK